MGGPGIYNNEWGSETARRFLGDMIVDGARRVDKEDIDQLSQPCAQQKAYYLVQRALADVLFMTTSREIVWEEQEEEQGRKVWMAEAPLRNFKGETLVLLVKYRIQSIPFDQGNGKLLCLGFNIKDILPSLFDNYALSPPRSFHEIPNNERTQREARPLVSLSRLLC
jgi:hypothetical protein